MNGGMNGVTMAVTAMARYGELRDSVINIVLNFLLSDCVRPRWFVRIIFSGGLISGVRNTEGITFGDIFFRRL